MTLPFADIHCHLVPGIDDGSKDWDMTLAMARMAVEDGFSTIICTPHQLGNFRMNCGDAIRQKTAQVQEFLNQHQLPLRVLPGGDVRIEDGMLELIQSGEVMTLADRRKHVLLELPHELYFPLDGLLSRMHACRLVGILSHPERNHGILENSSVLAPLVDRGCLMQVTAGSLVGTFGPASQKLSEKMLSEGLVHFISTDAHSHKSRRPLMRRAFDRVVELTDEETALDLCCRNGAQVAAGQDVKAGRRPVRLRAKGLRELFGWRRAA